jgi:hypothetical protein
MRMASTLTLAALVATASTAQAEAPRPLNRTAKKASDAFVHALVVKHDVPSARPFASRRFSDLARLRAGLVKDGVNTVAGPSRIVRGCRSTSKAKVSPRGDCVFYHLRGRRRTGADERRTDAEFKIWLRIEMGSWKVWAYAYSALVTVCRAPCR